MAFLRVTRDCKNLHSRSHRSEPHARVAFEQSCLKSMLAVSQVIDFQIVAKRTLLEEIATMYGITALVRLEVDFFVVPVEPGPPATRRLRSSQAPKQRATVRATRGIPIGGSMVSGGESPLNP
jgi:hypothetical protein